jgi:hypothetical protein
LDIADAYAPLSWVEARAVVLLAQVFRAHDRMLLALKEVREACELRVEALETELLLQESELLDGQGANTPLRAVGRALGASEPPAGCLIPKAPPAPALVRSVRRWLGQSVRLDDAQDPLFVVVGVLEGPGEGILALLSRDTFERFTPLLAPASRARMTGAPPPDDSGGRPAFFEEESWSHFGVHSRAGGRLHPCWVLGAQGWDRVRKSGARAEALEPHPGQEVVLHAPGSEGRAVWYPLPPCPRAQMHVAPVSFDVCEDGAPGPLAYLNLSARDWTFWRPAHRMDADEAAFQVRKARNMQCNMTEGRSADRQDGESRDCDSRERRGAGARFRERDLVLRQVPRDRRQEAEEELRRWAGALVNIVVNTKGARSTFQAKVRATHETLPPFVL